MHSNQFAFAHVPLETLASGVAKYQNTQKNVKTRELHTKKLLPSFLNLLKLESNECYHSGLRFIYLLILFFVTEHYSFENTYCQLNCHLSYYICYLQHGYLSLSTYLLVYVSFVYSRSKENKKSKVPDPFYYLVRFEKTSL